MSATLGRLWAPEPIRNVGLLIGSSVATTLVVVALVRISLSAPKKIIASPRATLLPKISPAEQRELPYPPDVFPGARDVASPYGSIRIYEFGPEQGKKVLLIHGISTPCISLGGIAHALAEKGCRVMLLDLWGRGYSDTVDLPHDSRLYTTGILLALTSSPLSWTPGGFDLIGYSLGGGIAVDFAACFPNLVKGLVLLAPSGLIRESHFGWQSRLMYSGWIPDTILEWAVKRQLRHTAYKGPPPGTAPPEKAVNEAIQGTRDLGFESAALSKTRPHVTVASAVQWQLDHHEGFVKSFVNSIKHSSILGKESTWRKLRGRKENVLIIVGSMDVIIVPGELHDDAIAAIGKEKVVWRVVEGGHDFAITKVAEVMKEVGEQWDI